MPLTPFLGLSVVVHLGFIISHRFFKLAHKGEQGKMGMKRGRSRLNFIVVMAIFLLVVFSASLLIKESLVEKHSSVYFAEKEAAVFYLAIKAAPTPGGAGVALAAPGTGQPAGESVFGQLQKAGMLEACMLPYSGYLTARDYLLTYGSDVFMGNFLTRDAKSDNQVSPAAANVGLSPQKLSFGVCAPAAGRYLIN